MMRQEGEFCSTGDEDKINFIIVGITKNSISAGIDTSITSCLLKQLQKKKLEILFWIIHNYYNRLAQSTHIILSFYVLCCKRIQSKARTPTSIGITSIQLEEVVAKVNFSASNRSTLFSPFYVCQPESRSPCSTTPANQGAVLPLRRRLYVRTYL